MLIFYFVAHTANILGLFNDPFEFEGDYGSEINPVRQRVFELVVPKEAIARNYTEFDVMEYVQKQGSVEGIEACKNRLIAEAIQEDAEHGPKLNELINTELLNLLYAKQQELEASGFSKEDLNKICAFVDRFGEKKIFRFLRSNPQGWVRLEKVLWNKASQDGKGLHLPVLGSTKAFATTDQTQLKKDLLNQLFTAELLKDAAQDISTPVIDEFFLKQTLGEKAHIEDVEVFFTPSGQIAFYWMYQSLYLHLISEDAALVQEVNKVKEVFARTLGNTQKRTELFRDKLLQAGTSVLFTQECDATVASELTKDGLFHAITDQNPKDGTFVFLKSDVWEPSHQVIEVEGYEGFKRGKINLILATLKESGGKFLLASAHGNSTRPEDGRLQVTLIAEVFKQLQEKHKDIQLLIGIDANTKSHKDVEDMQKHLETLGLEGTSVGPTTVKKRMVTTQHSKTARAAIDEEDYLITLKPAEGMPSALTEITVGFREAKPDLKNALPNLENPSDHYPVGAKVVVSHKE